MRVVSVWDPFVRAFHWSLAAAFLANYLELTDPGKQAHRVLGYVTVGLVLARILWGFAGPRHARFSDFVRQPGAVIAFAKDVLRHRDSRYLGHNPAGGAMVLVLLSGILLAGLTGWMQGTDRFFGVEWVESVHVVLVNFLFAMVLVHVVGVLHASWRHREVLIGSMITGKKRAQ